MPMGVAVGVRVHVMMMPMMTEQGRCGARWRRHLVHVQRSLLVLRLSAPERRLQRHHALPIGGQAALVAGAIAVLAVPLVAL